MTSLLRSKASQPSISYVSLIPFNDWVFSYSFNFKTKVGTLTALDISEDVAVARTILRDTGKRLFPGANPGVTVPLISIGFVGADGITYKGYIDPTNQAVFAIYTTVIADQTTASDSNGVPAVIAPLTVEITSDTTLTPSQGGAIFSVSQGDTNVFITLPPAAQMKGITYRFSLFGTGASNVYIIRSEVETEESNLYGFIIANTAMTNFDGVAGIFFNALTAVRGDYIQVAGISDNEIHAQGYSAADDGIEKFVIG